MSNTPVPSILRIDSSGRSTGSASRALTDQLIARLRAENPEARIVTRDVAWGLPFVTENWINANFTPEDERDDGHREALAQSDALQTLVDTRPSQKRVESKALQSHL